MLRKKGLTLVELMVVLVLIISVIGVFLASYILAETSWQATAARLVVQRHAEIAFEKTTRALRKSRNPIIEDAGDSISFQNIVGTESKIYLQPSGETINGKPVYNLIFDDDTSSPGDERIIARSLLKQDGFNFFTADGDDIKKIFIAYRVSDTNPRDGFQILDLYTMVKTRN